jgi:hypothetical protein
VAAVFVALAGVLLWCAFHPRAFSRGLGTEPVLLGLVCLYFAWRAVEQWTGNRRR